MKYSFLKTLTTILLVSSSLPQERLPAGDLVKSGLIVAPEEVEAGDTIIIQLKGDFSYTITPSVIPIKLKDDEGNRVLLILNSKSPGYTLSVNHSVTHPNEEEIANTPVVTDPKDVSQVAKFKEYLREHSKDEIFSDSHYVKVGKSPPNPEPGPTPTPSPDNPAPIPVDGFRVLILYETGNVQKLPTSQQAIIYGKVVRDYLNSTCVKEADETSAYRIYDKDTDVSRDLEVWKNAFQRRPLSIPWVIISNGVTGYEGPLPKTVEEFLTLCKKYEVK